MTPDTPRPADPLTELREAVDTASHFPDCSQDPADCECLSRLDVLHMIDATRAPRSDDPYESAYTTKREAFEAGARDERDAYDSGVVVPRSDDALRAAAQNLSDRRTLMDEGFWVSQKEMRALDNALATSAPPSPTAPYIPYMEMKETP